MYVGTAGRVAFTVTANVALCCVDRIAPVGARGAFGHAKVAEHFDAAMSKHFLSSTKKSSLTGPASPVPLPESSATHFFIRFVSSALLKPTVVPNALSVSLSLSLARALRHSHSQATGGDQANGSSLMPSATLR